VNINGGRDFDTDDLRVAASTAGDSPNTSPSAAFDFDCTDLDCSFTDSSTDSDGSIVSWSWDFGDGGTSTAQNPTHDYASAGTYTVTLTVTDDDGATDSESKTVTAQQPPEPPDGIVFFDDFADGDLSPWAQLKYGQVVMVNDPVDGWVLRKTTNNDPHGGWAPLGSALNDFELVLYARKVNTAGGTRLRYSLTDSSGNGYGLDLDYSKDDLAIERRSKWGGTKLAVSGASLPGGMALGQWYTLRLVRSGHQLTAEAYVGRVAPADAVPDLVVDTADSAFSSFTQVNINGGRDFDTDDLRVSSATAGESINTRSIW
jgi:PKD repeat protein